jgi:hypothetical protein
MRPRKTKKFRCESSMDSQRPDAECCVRLVNFRRLEMLKIFQEVCDSWLQRSRLLPSIVGLEFVSDEVPEQAEVSPFFLRFLKIFCLHVLALRYCPQ